MPIPQLLSITMQHMESPKLAWNTIVQGTSMYTVNIGQ